MGGGQKRSWAQSSLDDGPDDEGRSGSTSHKKAATRVATMSVFRPPVLRSAAITASSMVNKALFTQTFDIAAARIHDPRNISKYQRALNKSHELLELERLSSVVNDPELVADGAKTKPKKCILLNTQISAAAPETWSDVLKEGVERDELGVIPYKLTLDYDYWNARDIFLSLLPEEYHDEIPGGFNTAGHVAHLNLRDRFQPYKHLVANVLLDKNPVLRTVINKTENVGTVSRFRTFPYEVLAGPDDLQVEVRENMCAFHFDYSRVYWNSRLEKEHTRLLDLFRPGQVVVDVMAGIGPFAVPAGRRGVFVWANDMNPDSHAALAEAIRRNKVDDYVRPFNEDGMVFIRQAAQLVQTAAAARDGAPEILDAPSRPAKGTMPVTKHQKKPKPKRRFVTVPRTIDHFVMNLPASAMEFLPQFRGLYDGYEPWFEDSKTQKAETLPIVHVHCFAQKAVDHDNSAARADVCARVAEQLQVPTRLVARMEDVLQSASTGWLATEATPVYVHDVRDVSPQKSMYCASFRLPGAVAFAPREQ